MATLNKLLVGGVRSFGSDGNDQQRIYFGKPFNLILGRNGCGKTTIIEALKYACSGTMPPGQGQNFVRDPRLDRTSETRAQIKLKFTNSRGQECTITRNMSSKAKGKSSQNEFKTLDTTSEIIKDGKVEHMSGRCTDMDDLMIQLLGVSKPILNYVIFCHQEDSHWPLDEGKKLKDRFDEIFDSTKYNKCMVEVRKLRKIAIDEKKLSEVSIRHLEVDVNTLKQKRGELQLLIERLSKMEGDLKTYASELEKHSNERSVWIRRYNEYEKCKAGKDEAKNLLSKLVYEQDTEKKHIEYLFTGTEDELEVEIRSFDNQLQKKQKASEQIQRELQKLSDLESRIQTKILNIQKQICKFEADKEQEQKTKEDRNVKLSNLAKSFELAGLSPDASEGEVDQLHGQVKRKFQSLVSSVNSLKLEQEKEQNDLQEEINKCLQVKTKIESEIHVKEDNVTSNVSEIKNLQNKLRAVNEHLRKKQQVEKELDECRERRDKAIKDEDSDALSLKINDLQQICSTLEQRQTLLSTELVELLKYQGSQKNLQTQEEKHKDTIVQIQRLRCKNEDSISKLLPNSSDGSIRQDFDNLLQKLKREVDNLKNKKNEKNSEITSLDQTRNHKKSLLERKQADLKIKKESLFKHCGRQKLDEVLHTLDTKIESLQNDRGLFNSTQIVLGGYVKQLRQSDPCCPLCHRGFTDDHESSDLVEEIEGNMNNLPHRVEMVNEELSKLQLEQRNLLQLKPTEKEVTELESELPAMENEVLGFEGLLEAAREDLRDVEARLLGPEGDLRTAEDIQSVIFDIDRYQKEGKLCARQIDSLKRELSHLTSASRTSEQCAAEQQLISDELSSNRREKDYLEKRHREYLKRINDFDQKINKLVAQQLEIKEFIQQEEVIKERLTELSALNDMIQTEIEELNLKLKPAFDKKRNAEVALDITKEKHKRELQEMDNKKQEKEMKIKMLGQIEETLSHLKSLKISESLKTCMEEAEILALENNELKAKQDDLVKQNNDLLEALGENSKRKKELESNMTVLKLSKQIEKQKKVLEIAENKLGDTDFEGVMNKINEIDQEIADVQRMRNELKGNRKGLEDNIKSREDELLMDQYRNAERKYKEKLIKLTIQSYTERDLQKYYNALDNAMQHFHKDRMERVNKIIRQLWRLIYRGNDIDFIQIKTDESAIGQATNLTDRKRNYNYRVVQVKSGTEIDMRGRCSAGQKVLASLIIRLALAETFSANCGILALDEPTTNLDKDNIRSLCHAIVELVNEREMTSSFQLICITHDHQFLDMMTEMDFFSHYWEVSRDHRSKSVIRKKEVMKEN